MFLLFFIAIITLSISLHGMKNQPLHNVENNWALYKQIMTTPHTQLKSCSYNPDSIGTIINFADKSGDRYSMAKLIYLCLPKEVIKEYIAPHLVKSIATKYKHKLIMYKSYKNYFTKTIEHNDQWDFLSRHDGTFSIAPNIGHPYAMWNENETDLRNYITYDNEEYTAQLRSAENQNGIRRVLAILNTQDPEEQDKKITLFSEKDGQIYEKISTITSSHPTYRHLFSSDNSLLAFCTHKAAIGVINIFNTKTTEKIQWYLNGSISALCSAHHSPIFAAGSNRSRSWLHNLIIAKEGKAIHLKTHDPMITCVEFSPDDTRLLSCSYDEIIDFYQLKLWDTSDINWNTIHSHNVTCIYNEQSGGRILKAFFISNGQRIATINTNGHIEFYNGLTGAPINNEHWTSWSHGLQDNINDTPLTIWGDKNSLLITAHNDKIKIRTSKTGNLLCHHSINLTFMPMGMGLTADESTIVFVDANKNAHQLQLYNDQESTEIDFIEKETNIVQLSEMLDIHKQYKDHLANTALRKIKLYTLTTKNFRK